MRLLGLGLFAWALPGFSGVQKLVPVVLFAIIDYICSDFSSTAYAASVHELVNEQKIQKLSSLTSTAGSISSIFRRCWAWDFTRLSGLKPLFSWKWFRQRSRFDYADDEVSCDQAAADREKCCCQSAIGNV